METQGNAYARMQVAFTYERILDFLPEACEFLNNNEVEPTAIPGSTGAKIFGFQEPKQRLLRPRRITKRD